MASTTERPERRSVFQGSRCHFPLNLTKSTGRSCVNSRKTDAFRMSNCRAAWVYFLTALKTRIEHGIDVRDRSRTTGSSYSTYFDPRAVGFEPEPAGR